jgi:type IV secretory pathway VirB2 component (pilin)
MTQSQITLCIAGIIAVAVLGLNLAFGYENGFDVRKDTVTILTQVASFVGVILGSKMIPNGGEKQ